MKILIDIGHPAHVHLFKHLIWELTNKGHEIKITARNKEIALYLLDSYGFDYTVISNVGKGLLGIGNEMLIRDYRLFKIAKNFSPDIMIAVLDPSIAQVGKLLRIPSITFTDSEPEAIKYPLADMITLPFTDVILTLKSVRHNYGNKEIRMNGYKELAYLHPNHFKPNIEVLEETGISKKEEFVLLRFVAWKAYHDSMRGGFDLETKRKLVEELEKHATVFISSEAPLPKELEKYRLPISPEKIHDFLYCANLLVCDSQTMTTEAGVLGTPAIRCNSFVGENDMGNFIELEQKYDLIFNYNDPNKAIEKAVKLIQKQNLKEEWQKKREMLLKDKIDVTAFMVWFIENYPESFKEMKENPDIQYRFR
jgi:predicted glycosyltransferase